MSCPPTPHRPTQEERLILNVTVLASQPDDHLADGEPLKHGMVTPAPLTLLPDGTQIEMFRGRGLGKDDLRGVPPVPVSPATPG